MPGNLGDTDEVFPAIVLPLKSYLGFPPSSPWLEAGSEAKPEAGLVKAVGLDEKKFGRRLFTAEPPWSGFP